MVRFVEDSIVLSLTTYSLYAWYTSHLTPEELLKATWCQLYSFQLIPIRMVHPWWITSPISLSSLLMTNSSFFPQRPGWQQWRWISSSKLVCLGYEEEGNDVSGTAMFQICRKPEIPTCFESPDDVCDDDDGDDGVGDDGSDQLESVGITSLLASSWPTHHAWLLTKLMNNVHW